MNRKIKFRVWDNADKRFLWFFNSDILDEIFGQSHSDAPISERTGRIFVRNSSDYVLQQFTGLLDKNRKEIFEGDKCIANSGIIGEIVFKNGRFAWTDGACHWDIIDFSKIEKRDSIADKLEVIGNIYDNPEILKK